MPRHPRQVGKKAQDGAGAVIPFSAKDSLLILVPLVRLLARAAARDAAGPLDRTTCCEPGNQHDDPA